MYLLDTNTLIYFFRGQGQVAQRLLATPPAEVAVPTLVLYELELGLAKSNQPERRRAQLDSFLSAVRVIPFGHDEARAAARLRARLESRGEPIGPVDVLIAGTALSRHATLVTRNTREFARVDGLQLVNWY